MPDICDLILDDHEMFRRRLAQLDQQRHAGSDALRGLWRPLGQLLDLHAAAEVVVYPRLLARGDDRRVEATDAISDHSAIRDAARAASKADVASGAWWQAAERAREQDNEHMGEEEREALADFRSHTEREMRDQLDATFVTFKQQHAGGPFQSRDQSPQRSVNDEEP